MAIFEEVKVEWRGQKRVIPPDRVLRAIAKVEDIVTLADLSRAQALGRPQVARLAMAYGALLRYAGIHNVKDEEVYDAMFGGQGGNMMEAITSAIIVLQALMIPPEHLRAAAEEAAAEGKEQATSGKSPAGEDSSPNATSSPSAPGG